MAALVSANAGLWHAQRDRLHELFEAHKAEKDMLDRIADELPGGLRRSQIAAHLRKLGLRRPGAGNRGAGRNDAATVRAILLQMVMQPVACGSLRAAMPSALKAGRLDRAWHRYQGILPSCITTCTGMLIAGEDRGQFFDIHIHSKKRRLENDMC